MNSIPCDRFALDYDRAFQDARADWTTTSLGLYDANTVQGRERREEFVCWIFACVRIRRVARRWNDDNDNNDAREDGDAKDDVSSSDDVPERLDVVVQLVAMRRLSILLYNNFDSMGRMWIMPCLNLSGF